MLLIAFRNLFQDKGRLLMNVGGVMVAVILMFSLFGLYRGARALDLKYISDNQADLVVLRAGMTDIYHGIPVVPLADLNSLSQEPGIAHVEPIIALRPAVEANGRTYHLFLASFTPGEKLGSPWQVSSGTASIGDSDILIPTALARTLHKKVGDSLQFTESDKQWRIAGLVPDAAAFGNYYSWISQAAAQPLAQVPGAVSFGYVRLADPSRAAAVAAQLAPKYPGLNIAAKQQLSRDEQVDFDFSCGPILEAMAAVSFLMGIAIIGLTAYASVVDKQREIGILKAIGLRLRQLYGIVLIQSLIMTALGLLMGGIAVAVIVYFLVSNLDLPYQASVGSSLLIVGLTFAMALVASVVPLRRLASIDPAETFKS